MAGETGGWYWWLMSLRPNPFRYFNSSPEVIRLVVMMYVRFPLSLRNVEDLLFERGIDICHETVRFWWNRFGPMFAGEIRRQRVNRMRGFRHWRWHLDEMYVKLNGEMVYLWRAVDHEGEILESYVTRKRDKSAALRFMKKALKRHGSPERITTDGLKSYPAAMRELGNLGRREMGLHLNNRAENTHLPFRRRERAMQRFRRMSSLQKFASVHASVHNHFALERHLVDRQTYRERRSAALAEWRSSWGEDWRGRAEMRPVESGSHKTDSTSPVGWEHIAFSGDFLWDNAAASAGRKALNLPQDIRVA